MKQEYMDTVVIGAGAAGLAMSHLLKEQGQSFLCLEAHKYPGGCAGYFKRGKFVFDAGATTLSGMAGNGPLATFFQRTGLSPELQRIDPGLIISLGEHRLSRFADLSQWITEQQRVFQEPALAQLWNRIEDLNQLAWSLSHASAHWPPHNITSLRKLLFAKTFKKMRLLPLFFRSFEDVMDLKNYSHEFRQMMDEILLISAQNTMASTPALMGIMGSSYPSDTWYPRGGMKQFFETLLMPLAKEVIFGVEIKSIQKKRDQYLLETNANESFHCKRVISSIPIWNTAKLLGVKFPQLETMKNHSWGALTAYYKIKLRREPDSLYHQVHSDKISAGGSRSLFLSLCPKDDLKRCDGVSQTLTASTHIHYEDYQKAISQGRKEQRTRWDLEFQNIIRNYFSDDLLELEAVGFGDPDTFIHYTHRDLGLVGGIPHSLSRNLLTYPKSGFFGGEIHQIGDTTFPGQGIVGVIQGAMNLGERLFR